MHGLQTTDLFVLVVYFVGITALGVWTARRVKSMADFVMPRRFGKISMLFFAFGTGTHSDQAVGVSSKSYTNGVSGIWYQWLWLFVTPFYWLIAPLMRRFRALTTADVFEARYDRSMAMFYAAIGCFQYVINIGVMLKGASAVIDASTGGEVPAEQAILLMTALFVIYGLAGGLSAAIVTDLIQGILTVGFSFLLLPYIFQAVGGMEGTRTAIAGVAEGRDMFSLVAPEEIGLFYVIVIAVNALVGIVTQPHAMGNCAAGRNELDGQIGFMGGNLLKRICTIAWCLTGLAAVAYFAGTEVPPDEVFGRVARDVLPRVLPGMLGLFLAGMLASVMSSCDAFMVSAGALFAENIYKPIVANRSDRHYLWVVRAASLAIVAGGILFAYALEGVVQGLERYWEIGAMLGPAFWLGLFWRRMTVAGAWAGSLSAIAVWFLTMQSFFIKLVASLPAAESLRLVVEKGGEPAMYLPWKMIFYLSAGLVASVAVSLATRRVDSGKLERYYALVRTPVDGPEEIPAPCTLPRDAVVPPRRVIFPSSDFEIPVPSRRAVLGFAAGWAAVALLVGVFVLIIKG